MPDSLQFMDCPHCAKRVRENAERCHHCGKSPRDVDSQADDFDYEAFLEAEFGKGNRAVERPWWWYVAWLVLAVLVVSLVMDALQLLPV